MRRLALVVCASLAACHDGGGGMPDLAPPLDPLVAARPYSVTLPAGHDDTKTWPLVVVLHGYMANGVVEDTYLGFSSHADEHGAIVAAPDGTVDQIGSNFWNADDACCDLFGTGVDDVAYLTAVIDDAIARYAADPKRVYLMGHSNGAFMAHRMACDRADRVAAIAALAGDVWKDTTKCQPTQHVAVAQIQGDKDDTVNYNGGTLYMTLAPYPGSPATFQYWSTAGACTGTMAGDPLDLDTSLPGAETTVTRATGCAPGAAAEMWTIVGGNHIPAVDATFPESVFAFFEAHAR